MRVDSSRGFLQADGQHGGPAVVSVVPTALCRSGSGRGEDRGEPLAPPAGAAGEPNPRGPHRLAGLGGGGVEGGAGRSLGPERRRRPGAAGVRGTLRPRRGGRSGGCGRDLAVPRLPARGGASGVAALGRSDWFRAEAPDPAVQSPLAEGAPEGPGRSRPLDRGDSC